MVSCCALAVGLTFAAAVASANAQAAATATTEEVTVTAPRAGPNARSLTKAVSYHDLDLTTQTGRNAHSQRIRTTARELCRSRATLSRGALSRVAQACELDGQLER